MVDDVVMNGDSRVGAFEVRPRQAGDCARVVGWVPDREALLLFTGHRLRWPLTADQLLRMDHLAGFTAWVLTEQGVPVGHFDVTATGAEAHVGRVIIDPSRRGRGLSHVLLRFAMETARSAGASTLGLNVIVGNEPAIRTYVGAGFRFSADGGRPGVHRMSVAL